MPFADTSPSLTKMTIMKIIKTYDELMELDTYEERLRYLASNNVVGEDKFGHDRYLNQAFYHSREWKRARRQAILRDSFGDNVCDMGLKDFPIIGRVIVHHINEVTLEDLEEGSDKLFDLNNLICVSHDTHELITFGAKNYRAPQYVERKPNDTCPWR